MAELFEALFADDHENLVENQVRLALHQLRQVEGTDVVAVIGDAVLRKVVGADSLAAVAGADLGAFVGGLLAGLFLLFVLQHPGVQNAQRDLLVAVLGLLLLARHGESGRDVGYPHGRVGRVYALAAGAARTEHVETQVFRPDVEFDLLGLRP